MSKEATRIKNALRNTLNAFTTDEIEVRIQSIGEEGTASKITIHPTRADYGRVCGIKGSMIRAIKHLVEVCGSRQINHPIKVSLEEPDRGLPSGRMPDPDPDQFNQEDFMEQLKQFMSAMNATGSIKCKEIKKPLYKIEITHNIYTDDFDKNLQTLFKAVAKATGGELEFYIHEE